MWRVGDTSRGRGEAVIEPWSGYERLDTVPTWTTQYTMISSQNSASQNAVLFDIYISKTTTNDEACSCDKALTSSFVITTEASTCSPFSQRSRYRNAKYTPRMPPVYSLVQSARTTLAENAADTQWHLAIFSCCGLMQQYTQPAALTLFLFRFCFFYALLGS
jgi:hypothetical protein